MNKTQVATENLDQALVTLMNKLGYGAEQLWTLYVEAQKAQAIANSVKLGMTFLIMGASLTIFWKQRSIMYDDLYDPSTADKAILGLMGALIVALASSLVGYIVGDLIAYEIILKLLAPEYTAAQELITQLDRLT